MDKLFKDEAHTFAWDIATTHQILCVDNDDYIWDKVCTSAKQYNDDYNSCDRRKDACFPFAAFERPDILFDGGEFVLGIECFDFDASLKSSKNGSSQYFEEAQADKRINEKYKKFRAVSDSNVTISESVNVQLSLKSCVDTLLQNFDKHSRNIERYRQNIRRIFPGKDTYLAFYITDTTAMGNFISVDGRLRPISPLLIPQFIDAISHAPGLDYIVTNTKDFYHVHTIEIAPIREKFIQSLRENCYDMSSLQYYPYRWKRTASFYSVDVEDSD